MNFIFDNTISPTNILYKTIYVSKVLQNQSDFFNLKRAGSCTEYGPSFFGDLLQGDWNAFTNIVWQNHMPR